MLICQASSWSHCTNHKKMKSTRKLFCLFLFIFITFVVKIFVVLTHFLLTSVQKIFIFQFFLPFGISLIFPLFILFRLMIIHETLNWCWFEGERWGVKDEMLQVVRKLQLVPYRGSTSAIHTCMHVHTYRCLLMWFKHEDV